MKIFNWVHRRFHRKDGLGGSVKQTELVRNDDEKQVLLEHTTLAKVVDGWRDGTAFLSIGTFGFEPLEDFINQVDKEEEEEEFIDDDDDGEYCIDGTADEEDDYKEDNEIVEEDEGELNPLMLTSFRHGFDAENGAKTDDDSEDLIMTTIEAVTPWPAPHVRDQLGSLEDERMRKKKAERTTLADLFSADSGDHDDPKFHAAEYCCKKAAVLLHHKNNGTSFAKKLLPRVHVAEDSRPIQKLHRLMTRMLKRRIHPDFEGKIEKKDMLGGPTDEYGATLSLL